MVFLSISKDEKAYGNSFGVPSYSVTINSR